MKEFHLSMPKIEVDFKLRDGLTLIMGNSGTGKTFLVKSIKRYVSVTHDTHVCVVYTIQDIQEALNKKNGDLFLFVDEIECNKDNKSLLSALTNIIFTFSDCYVILMQRGPIMIPFVESMFAELHGSLKDNRVKFSLEYIYEY